MLGNDKIILRALEFEDIDVLYRWENNSEIWHLSNTLVPFSKNILKKYIEYSHQDIYESKQLRLIIQDKISNKPVGAIDLFDFDPFNNRAGIGILINDEIDRKHGYASAALDILIKYSFNILNLNQLYCNILVTNVASIKLFEKFNFEIVGVKKNWVKIGTKYYDEILFQLLNK